MWEEGNFVGEGPPGHFEQRENGRHPVMQKGGLPPHPGALRTMPVRRASLAYGHGFAARRVESPERLHFLTYSRREHPCFQSEKYLTLMAPGGFALKSRRRMASLRNIR